MRRVYERRFRVVGHSFFNYLAKEPNPWKRILLRDLPKKAPRFAVLRTYAGLCGTCGMAIGGFAEAIQVRKGISAYLRELEPSMTLDAGRYCYRVKVAGKPVQYSDELLMDLLNMKARGREKGKKLPRLDLTRCTNEQLERIVAGEGPVAPWRAKTNADPH